MRSFRVKDLPLELHTASSKAEAIELLSGPLSGLVFPYIAVAFVDVVMENDQAGLELCQWIRETQRNGLTQLYIRTGQPGKAPERQVMERYSINGYFTKAEMTEDKLYSLVQAGVRQFDFMAMALTVFNAVVHATAAARSPELLTKFLNDVLVMMPLDSRGQASHPDSYDMQVCILIGDQLRCGSWEPATALAERDRLLKLGLKPLTPQGDEVVEVGGTQLIKAAATGTHDEAWHLGLFQSPPDGASTMLMLSFLKTIATLYKRLEAASPEPAAVG
jgi:CheY-like chemotaxis protein